MRTISWPVEGLPPLLGELPKTTSRISIIMLAIHVPLAAAMYLSRSVATLHALSIFLLGILFLAKRRNDLVFNMVGYVAGAEVLWRICSAQTNHEFAKYLGAFLLVGIGLRNLNFRRQPWVVFYFLLLLPSVFITLDELPLSIARKRLSFNLSGPAVLAISVIVMSNLRISAIQLRRFLLSFIYPLIGICTCIFISLLQAEDISFNTQSNFETSAGFGPNQVSSILAMGAILTYMFYMLFLNKRLFRSPLLQRQIAVWLSLLLLVQSAFTFSRGGVYMAVASIFVAGILLLKDREVRKKFILNTLVFSLLSFFVVLPALNNFTDGAFLQRYMETDTTGRSDILGLELTLWKKNILLGVGPGMRVYHIDEDVASAAHTEYTRMIGEHGLLGLFSLIILLLGLGLGFKSIKDYRTRALAGALMTCALLFWGVNGMRIFAPQLFVSLIFATILWKPTTDTFNPWRDIENMPPINPFLHQEPTAPITHAFPEHQEHP